MVSADKHLEPPSSVCHPLDAGLNFNPDPRWLQEPFEVWLQRKTAPATRRNFPGRALTATEATRVGLATVRESMRHRRWPTEVVEGFLAAEIVTRTLTPHAQLSNLGALARRFNLLRMFGEAGTPLTGTLRR